MRHLGLLLPVILIVACSGDAFESKSPSGGSSGSSATAGSPGSGGSGGSTAQGGGPGRGGGPTPGGGPGTGGGPTPGGGPGTGGEPPAGGSTGTGGEPVTGGSTGTGGEPVTGGSTGSGGTPPTGGAAGTGGVVVVGGTGGIALLGGSGGIAPIGGSAGTLPGPECETPEDCALHSDCCTCTAHSKDVSLGYCDMACTEEPCFIMGVSAQSLLCTAGHCSLGVSCNPNEATCYMNPPDCGPGHVPSVLGDCWGPCVDASDCAAVESCEACDLTRHVCVTLEAHLPTMVCVEAPDECAQKHNCDCLAPSVCIDPFDYCIDSGENQITCSCPTC